MDGFKKRLRESVQLRLSAALSLTIVLVAVIASVFAFFSALDEAHELQDENLHQIALLFDRQQMTLHYPQGLGPAGDDEESRVIIQYLVDGKKAPGNTDDALPLPLPTTLADGLSTVDVGGEAFRVLVRTTANGERIAVAQEVDARNKDARESAWRSVLPFLFCFLCCSWWSVTWCASCFGPSRPSPRKSTSVPSKHCIPLTSSIYPLKSAPLWWLSIACSPAWSSPWTASGALSPTPPTNCARP